MTCRIGGCGSGAVDEVEPVYDKDGITVYHGDCLDVLSALETVDHVITDPPYNVSSRNGRAGTTVGRVPRRDGTFREIKRDFGEWDYEWEPRPFLAESRRLIRRGGSLIAFTSEFLIAAYLGSGLDHRALLYWRKSNPSPNFRKQIVRSVEMAVWQTRGQAWTFNGGGYVPNVWDGPILSGYTVENTGEKRQHPTQKPLWLMKEWLSLFTDPGDLILDPFMGSGTTLVAAKELGRRAIGIEIDEKYVKVAIRRLENTAYKPPLLPVEPEPATQAVLLPLEGSMG